ncbi:MAG: NAD-dependent epimerase/dehydratase family protein [Thermodesulfobacteriota bacterium]
MNSAKDVVKMDLEYICECLEAEYAAISGKKLLITGGAGFLGYYLVQSILAWNDHSGPIQKIDLTVYDNFIRGVPAWLTALEGNEHLRVVKHDITRPLPDSIEDFQYIIHAASIASPTYYRQHPIETMDANVNGLRFLLEYCRKQKEKHQPVEGFLFFSSSEVYGDPTPENIPTPEDYYGYVSCTGPRACYDESKRFGETLCVNFARQHDLPVKMARPFNNYGPGLKITDKRVIPDFVRDIIADRDIVMYSDGSPTRTFCYVADAIVGYYKILVKGQPGEAYNIGVETPEISMSLLAETIVDLSKDIFEYVGRFVHRPNEDQDYLRDNPNRRCPNIKKARKALGYAPGIELQEGLRRSLIWYRENTEAEES